MFDIGWAELIVIIVVAVLVIGPKQMPTAMHAFGKSIGKVKSMIFDAQEQFSSSMEDTGITELARSARDIRNDLHPANLTGMLNSTSPTADDRKKKQSAKKTSTNKSSANKSSTNKSSANNSSANNSSANNSSSSNPSASTPEKAAAEAKSAPVAKSNNSADSAKKEAAPIKKKTTKSKVA